MSVPTYSVEIAWSTVKTGVFTLDSSLLDGTDVLGAQFGHYTWTDETANVKSVSISRGRLSDLTTTAQGVCSMTLKDPTGHYNPQNPSSALAGQLLPLRPVRVQATFSSVTYGLFFGYISRIESNPDPAVQETMIEAVDLFEWLNANNPTVTMQVNQTVDQLITKILAAIGFNDPASLNIQSGGDLVPLWSADGTKSALSLIQALLSTDLGIFFIDGQGRATYLTRATMQANVSPLATMDGTMVTGLKGSTDVKSLVNQQAVTRKGGVTQIVTDASATAENTLYGVRAGSPITSDYLASDAQAAGLALYLVTIGKSPRQPARAVALVNKTDAELTQQLAREIGDMVTVTESRGNTSTTGHIQAITHSITDGGLIFRTTWTVQQPALYVFTLDQSTLDGPDVLGY